MREATKTAPTGEMAVRERAIPRIPTATYRLQFSRDFTFQDALAIVPYLRDLGISDVYASPILKSRPGSHGYDVTDHTQLNPELGTEEDFNRLAEALRAHGMGLILDTVPNHMGIGADNPWWMDVLENGPSSVYANTFDIQWQPIKPELENRVLIPILGDQYGNILEDGQFKLVFEQGAFVITYHEHRLPVAPRTYSQILTLPLEQLTAQLGVDNEHVIELQSILTALSYLPPRTETAPERLAERAREKEVIKRRLDALYQASAEFRAALDTALATINGTPGDPRSFDRLDALIEAQAARPSYWRVAAEEINYRRFFDVNDLAAIKVELPEVFRLTHELFMRLLAEGKATGLRIDHPDGLWDPAAYFRSLQDAYRAALTEADGQPIPDDDGCPLYVVVEKILAHGEPLPENWDVYGTSGYDFLNEVNGLFVNRANARAFDRLYARFTGETTRFADLVYQTKKLILRVALVSEINTLSQRLDRLSERNRHTRDFTLNGITSAVREVIASLSVYRTYIVADNGEVSDRDCRVVEQAVAEAKRRNPETDPSVFDFLRDTLLLRNLDDFSEEDRAELANWVMKFQQLTGPVMAKGVEDTAFYSYNRLASLNEVGGHPDHFGVSVTEFHRANAARAATWPHSMLASSTHDTKRSEDVRARLNVLSELPDDWRRALSRWSRLNARHRTEHEGETLPSRNDEYLLYQTLLGAWHEPASDDDRAAFAERIVAYMRKATKEAKAHTSWLNANPAYDEAMEKFVRGVLGNRRFLADFAPFQRRVAFFGRLNSLAQTLLKLTAPGVPDIYQGTEMLDFSLVDPDNRRPVDFAQRAAALKQALGQGEAPNGRPHANGASEATSDDDAAKLALVARTLAFRHAHEALFKTGEYVPLEVVGAKREHVVAFARREGGDVVLVVVPRLVAGLVGGQETPPTGEAVWDDTRVVLPADLAGREFTHALSDGRLTPETGEGQPSLPLAAVLATAPLALLAAA